MRVVYKRRNKGQALEKPVKIHGILRCPEHGFCHRDKNAAVNIMAIYEAKPWLRGIPDRATLFLRDDTPEMEDLGPPDEALLKPHH